MSIVWRSASGSGRSCAYSRSASRFSTGRSGPPARRPPARELYRARLCLPALGGHAAGQRDARRTGGVPHGAQDGPDGAQPSCAIWGPLIACRIRDWGPRLLESAWHDPALATDEIRREYEQGLQVEDWDRALWELTAASRRPDLESRLDDITLPVLVVTGDDDRIVPTEHSVRLAGELPDAELVVFPSCGHLPQEECPAPFLEAVTAFVSTLPE